MCRPVRRFEPALCALAIAVGLGLAPCFVHADINLLAPSRIIDPAGGLRLTLIVTAAEQPRSHALPDVLRVALTPDLGATVNLNMRRVTPVPPRLDLRPGEFLRIEYAGEIPPNLRGRVRVDAFDLDVPTLVMRLSSTKDAAVAEAAPAVADPVAPPGAVPVTALAVGASNDPNRIDEGRLTFHEPMFFATGATSGAANAQMQLSFKLRLYEPADKLSRRLQHNLYFGYTQAGFWDLTGESKPFIDTRYKPSFFYYVPQTQWRLGGNAIGFAAGYEHESNGKDDIESRSLDTLFVRPYFTFGDAGGFHLTFSPKLYAYLNKSENSDIQRYRGYGDFRFTYGKNDDWQLALTARKGTGSGGFSSELQATYPLNRLAPGLSGYLMAQAFSGFGETLLGYNERTSWSVRFGYAVSR